MDPPTIDRGLGCYLQVSKIGPMAVLVLTITGHCPPASTPPPPTLPPADFTCGHDRESRRVPWTLKLMWEMQHWGRGWPRPLGVPDQQCAAFPVVSPLTDVAGAVAPHRRGHAVPRPMPRVLSVPVQLAGRTSTVSYLGRGCVDLAAVTAEPLAAEAAFIGNPPPPPGGFSHANLHRVS